MSHDHGTPDRWRSFPPFYGHLGLELESLRDGHGIIRLPRKDEFCNSRGEVHGGIVASLLDIALSQAVRSALSPTTSCATISLNLNYLGPAFGNLTCRAAVVRSGRRISFAEGEVVDEKGMAVCKAIGTYRIIVPKTATASTGGN